MVRYDPDTLESWTYLYNTIKGAERHRILYAAGATISILARVVPLKRLLAAESLDGRDDLWGAEAVAAQPIVTVEGLLAAGVTIDALFEAGIPWTDILGAGVTVRAALAVYSPWYLLTGATWKPYTQWEADPKAGQYDRWNPAADSAWRDALIAPIGGPAVTCKDLLLGGAVLGELLTYHGADASLLYAVYAEAGIRQTPLDALLRGAVQAGRLAVEEMYGSMVSRVTLLRTRGERPSWPVCSRLGRRPWCYWGRDVSI